MNQGCCFIASGFCNPSTGSHLACLLTFKTLMQLLLYISLVGILFLTACSHNPQGDKTNNPPTTNRPNVILLLVDDMGYGDLTCYGGQAVHTPSIDELAQQGMRFTRFYSASAVCSPSRAAILTGRYPLRYNIRRHLRDVKGEYLPVTGKEIPNLLKEAGYATAHIGKWHLGGVRQEDITARAEGQQTDPGPLQHGFDHMLTNIEGAPIRSNLINTRTLYRDGGKHLIRNDEFAPEDLNHWTNIKVDEAIRLLDQYQTEQTPFFINLWFDVPHTPYEAAPEPHLSKYAKMGATGDQLNFRSMVSNLDANIGRLLANLKDKDLYENTLIIFTSDNGAAWEGEVGPFKGGKTDLHEGGIRVPFFAVWPGKIPANTVSFQTGHHTDIFPTICEALDVPVVGLDLDGISLLPNLKNQKQIDRRPIVWQMDLYQNLQRHYKKPDPFATNITYHGPWKLLLDSITPVELFHLENDPHEVMNRLDQHPEIVEELTDATVEFLSAPRQ